MGKITDYFEQCRQDEEERKRKQTVATFAKELKKSAEALIDQLQAAGVKKVSETEQITEADKEALLRYLQKSHGVGERSRKKITRSYKCESEEQRLMKAVAAQENGAEWECLQQLAAHTYLGNAIDPGFQAVVNLIVAKSFMYQALPMKKLGRPKSQKTDDLGRKITQEYWDSRDSGASYSEAVQRLAERFHKDERHIMRLTEKHKKIVGLTFEEREEKREWAALRRQAFEFAGSSPSNSYLSEILEMLKPTPEFEPDDYIEYFDEQIVKTVQSRISTDIK